MKEKVPQETTDMDHLFCIKYLLGLPKTKPSHKRVPCSKEPTSHCKISLLNAMLIYILNRRKSI